MNRVTYNLVGAGLTLMLGATLATGQPPAATQPSSHAVAVEEEAARPASTQDKPQRPPGSAMFGRGAHPRFSPLSPREIQSAMDVLGRVDPKTARALQIRYEQDPQAVARILQKRFPRIRSFLAMQRWDPVGFDLRVEEMRRTHETRSLVQAYRQALEQQDDVLAQQTRQAIVDNITQRYDLRRQSQQHELDRLAQRMEQIRQRLDEDDAQRQQRVEARVNELLTPPQRESLGD